MAFLIQNYSKFMRVFVMISWAPIITIAMPIDQEKSIKARNCLKCRLGNFQSLQTNNRRRKFKK